MIITFDYLLPSFFINSMIDSHFHHNHHHHHHQHIIIWQPPEWLEEVTTLWLLFPSLFCPSANWGHLHQYCHRIWQLLQFSTSPFKFCRQHPKYGTYSFQIKANMKHKELSNHERKCQYFSKIKTVQNILYIYSYFIAFSSNFFSGLW